MLASRIRIDEGANRVFAERARNLLAALEPVVERLPGDEPVADRVRDHLTPEACVGLAWPSDGSSDDAVEALRKALTDMKYAPERGVDATFREQFGYAKGYYGFLTA